MKPQAKRIFWNAMLLSVASLFMRTVGVSFQVYLSNRVGEESMGLFSLLSGVYGFALTLATSGIHLGVTRLVVEAVGKGESGRVRSVMRKATLYALCFGCLSSSLLALFAGAIGTHWLKDARTVSSLRLLAITLPLISLSSAWGGYFTAVRRAYKSAAVQVAEQALKIGFTMQLLAHVLPFGAEGTLCVLVLGGALAEICSFFLEWILYLFDKRKSFGRITPLPPNGEGRALMGISLPIAFTTYIRSALVTLQHILIPEGLRSSGASHTQALVAYANIHSMALPVILYPAALIYSFSGLLVPEIAESTVQNATRRIRYIISRVWSLALLFSIGVSGILICFSQELGALLYPGTSAGTYIRILAPLVPIMYLDTATDAMLKGLGQQVYSMNINILDALLSVILVWTLVPRYGIDGYLVTVYVSELFNTVLSITRLLCISRVQVRLMKWIYGPLLCIVGATYATRTLLRLIGPYPSAPTALGLTLHCALTLLLYLLLLVLTKSIGREELSWTRTLFQRSADAS
ncbi:MAG: polysaccharide biosynthesis C-terminal domain-containing protein [Clostridia bacterium]|nr:polysaccharide biosynthesis C-terminal domain-containing protein [Clostridia bacterium]